MKTILITGATGGLGTVAARHFLAKGYLVIGTTHTNDAMHILPRQPDLYLQKVDLSNEEETTLFVQDCVKRFHKIDALLCLAGGFAAGTPEHTSATAVQQQINLNFFTAFHLIQPLFKHMLQNNEGKIVLIGARPAIEASAGKDAVAYALSKSLLFSYARVLNEAAKGKKVSTTVIVPSIINTEANRKAMPTANFTDWVTPEALTEILEFIVSEKANPLKETVLKVYNNA